jgi:hypothetical protein
MVKKVNMVQILYANVKMITVETIPGLERGRIKENDGGMN